MMQLKIFRLIVILFTVLFINKASIAQIIGDYRSKQTGNWNDFNTWERYDGSAWVAALSGQTPGVAPACNVLIRNLHLLTLNATPVNSLNSLTIGEGAGGILEYYNSSTTVTLTIDGIFNMKSGSIFRSYATPTVNGTHMLKIGGDFINNGAITLRQTSGIYTAAVNVSFNGASDIKYYGNGSALFNNLIQDNTFLPSGVSINNTITVAGKLSISAGNILTLNAVTVNLKGTLTALEIFGTLLDAGNSTLIVNGTAAQQLSVNDFELSNLTIDNTAGVSLSGGGNAMITGTLTLISGVLNIGSSDLMLYGNLSINSGSLSGTNTLSGITVGEKVPNTQATLTLPAIGGTGLKNLTVRRSNGVILGAPLTLGSGGILTLERGIVNTTATNLLTITNATVTGSNLSITVTSPAGNSWVRGPIRRQHNFSSASVYTFPVGDGNYQGMTVAFNAAVNSNSLTAEVTDGSSGGNAGTGMGGALFNRYWKMNSGSSIAAAATIKIYDLENAYTGSVIGYAATQTGTYNSIGGTTSQNIVTSTTYAVPNPISAAYFTMTVAPVLTSGIYSLPGTVNASTVSNLSQLAALLNTGSFVINDTTIFEFDATYPTAIETFPILFNRFYGKGQVIIRPASSVATTLETKGDAGSSNALISFNGTQNLIWDGVPGGASVSNTLADIKWIVRNTRTLATVGPTIQFNNDACGNTIQYLQIEGQNISTTSGTVYFGNTASVSGNKSNNILYCILRDRSDAIGNPVNAIYSVGNAGINKMGNDYNNVKGCNIFNFFSATLSTAGIVIGSYSDGWKISGNSFYQTVTRTHTGAGTKHYGIYIKNTNTGTTYEVSDNFIGGSSAEANGSTWIQNGTVNSTFIGIHVDGTTAARHTIKNNIIRKISWSCSNNTTNAAPGIFCGIYVLNGGALIKNNILGCDTGTSSIAVSSTSNGSQTFGIVFDGSSGTASVLENKIGSITTVGSTSVNHSFTAISMNQAGSGSIRTIRGNLIGSLVTANSINTTSASTSGTAPLQNLRGITITVATNKILIADNEIANLNNNYTGTANAQVVGIDVPALTSSSIVSGNKVHHLSSQSASIGMGSSSSVIGIAYTATTANQLIVNNLVYALINKNNTAATSVTGIFYYPMNGTSGINRFQSNKVNTLMLETSNTSGNITGIYIGNAGSNLGTTHFVNNAVHLGLNESGSGLNAGYSIVGINEIAGTDHFYFNTIYVGGGNATTNSAIISSAFKSSATANSQRELSNNIFYNARSNQNALGYNYAMLLSNLTNTGSNYNDLYVSGTNGIIANAGSNQTPLSNWQSSTGKDVNSISADPQFLQSGIGVPYTSIDLHISESSPANNAGGQLNYSDTYDIEGALRNEFTPVDIGAYASQPSILAVLFASFIVEKWNKDAALLQWSSLSEHNTSHYEIEVMKENEKVFSKIGEVNAAGYSETKQNYQFIDEEGNKRGIRYYRIKEVDYSGKETYSSIRALYFEYDDFQIICFPNPATDYTILRINNTRSGQYDVRIMTLAGQELWNKQIYASQGFVEQQLSLHDLTTGVYIIEITESQTGMRSIYKIIR